MIVNIKTCLLLLVIVWAERVSAQSNFQPGYFIQPTGDTVRGEVAVLGTQRSIRRCVFRSSPATAPVTYLPNQVKGYGIWKVKDYRSGLVPVVDTTRQLRFMEVLVRGKATLLLSSDNNNNYHFFLHRDGQSALEELRLITRTQIDKGRVYKQEIKQYQQTLLAAFADYPELSPDIQRARFGVQDLTKIFDRYNAGVGSATQVNATALSRTKFRFGLVAGPSLGGKMKIKSGASRAGYYNTTLTKTANPIIGVQVAAKSPRLNQNLWLQIGVLYQHRNYTGQQGRGSALTSSLDDYYDLAFEADFVHVPVVVRFESAKGRFRPLVEVGITSNFRLNESRNEINIHYTNNQAPTQRWLFEQPRGYEQGLLTGLGLVTTLFNGHLASVVVRYELTNGVSNSIAISTICSTFFVLLSYDLVGK